MTAILRLIAISLAALFISVNAQAEEGINRFDVVIEVEKDGDIVVTETINVTVEGQQIRRGIFRDLPAYYRDPDREGDRLPYQYNVLSVRRDGSREPYDRSVENNAMRIRIGDPDRFLERRDHTYEIRYRVKNQVRYFDNYDEVFWNVTGNYWAFPIKSASARITLPNGAGAIQTAGYTGGQGQTGADYTYRRDGEAHVFTTTQPLDRREGLTVAVGFEKGIVDPPSAGDRGWLWWARHGALAILAASFIGLLTFFYRNFNRVGRDPSKGPVFPRYEAPSGYSPAAVHHIYNRGFSGHDALIATIMDMSMKGRMSIEASEKDKKKTTLRFEDTGTAKLDAISSGLLDGLFSNRSSVKLGEKYDSKFTSAYTQFRKSVSKDYGTSYFKWNAGYTILGALASGGAVIFAIMQAHNWSGLHTLGVLAIVVLNLVFMYLMPAPTRKGQDVRTEIEGFKLYMEKAEKLQLNAVEVGSEAPPPMTTERYEKFLPYAVALGVEKPWTKHFERLIPKDAAAYNPGWTNMNSRNFGSMSNMTSRMVSGMSSGVTSAMPQSSSSSGSGGGGFSGGGGGGGGGGGW
ncbi:MAG: DUF2207 domain-containing protein [Pseudomonadota bacterium]